jgi:hypothetical protein
MNSSNNSLDADHVFYVTSRGYAADHWYAWFSKALNAHPEVFAYLANEGSRPKYFSERTRAERPQIVRFTQFIADVGKTYKAIGDCYSYRANRMKPLQESFGDNVPVINLVRHPYSWLKFYVRWRSKNMRMPNGETGPIDHEWNISQHDLFRSLGLRPYGKEDVEVWSTYQGLYHLKNIVADVESGIKQVVLEDVVKDQSLFLETISYLTHDRVTYDKSLLDLVYSWVWKPFPGEGRLRVVPKEEYDIWPEWHHEAFSKIVTNEVKECYQKLGYEL